MNIAMASGSHQALVLIIALVGISLSGCVNPPGTSSASEGSSVSLESQISSIELGDHRFRYLLDTTDCPWEPPTPLDVHYIGTVTRKTDFDAQHEYRLRIDLCTAVTGGSLFLFWNGESTVVGPRAFGGHPGESCVLHDMCIQVENQGPQELRFRGRSPETGGEGGDDCPVSWKSCGVRWDRQAADGHQARWAITVEDTSLQGLTFPFGLVQEVPFRTNGIEAGFVFNQTLTHGTTQSAPVQDAISWSVAFEVRRNEGAWPIAGLTVGGQVYTLKQAMAFLTDEQDQPANRLGTLVVGAKLLPAQEGGDLSLLVEQAEAILSQGCDRLPCIVNPASERARDMNGLSNQIAEIVHLGER